MTWLVRLAGHEFDLTELTTRLTSPSLRVVQDGDPYYLTSTAFDALMESGDVLHEAERQMALLNALMAVKVGNYRPVETDGMVEYVDSEGQRKRIIHASAAASGRAKLSLNLTVLDAGGRAVEQPIQPSDDPDTVTALAAADEEVARALRMIGSANTSWAALYHVYEIVEADQGGEKGMLARGRVSSNEIKRFKGTANSNDAVGEAARHGRRYEAPRQPMSLAEADVLVKELVNRWLTAKVASHLARP